MRKASTCRSERQISIGEGAKERTKGRHGGACGLERAAGERHAADAAARGKATRPRWRRPILKDGLKGARRGDAHDGLGCSSRCTHGLAVPA